MFTPIGRKFYTKPEDTKEETVCTQVQRKDKRQPNKENNQKFLMKYMRLLCLRNIKNIKRLQKRVKNRTEK